MQYFRSLLFLFGLSLFSSSLSADEPQRVESARLAEIAVYPLRNAPATVVSLNATGVASEIPAKIIELDARVGDIVDKGKVLVRLKCIDFELVQKEGEARLRALAARIDLAKRRLERTRKLTMKQSVSEELLDERESDLAVLQADRVAAQALLNQARERVSNCIIKSPFRALVTERTSSVGNYAEVGKTLVRILDIDQLEISAQVNAGDVQQFEHVAELFFEHEGQNYQVKLRAILPSINSETRNREVRLLFQNGPALPGAAGKLNWRETRPHVPGNLIVKRDGVLGIFVLENDKVRFVEVPGAQSGRASPVDLDGDAKIITVGQYALTDNETVVSQ